MKKESVIEREIRLAKEREEAFRKEKGLPLISTNAISKSHSQKCSQESQNSASCEKTVQEGQERGVQHRIATSRIQQEIEETSRREKELRSAGKIKTLSEDTVDAKVNLYI